MLMCLPRYRKRLFCRLVLVLTLVFGIAYWQDWIPEWSNTPKTFSPGQLESIKARLSSMTGLFPLNIETDMKLNLDASASNKVGVLREVPDGRPDACKKITYDNQHMPTASIVISYHNEIWSVILRTVTSVFFRTPQHLLQEIILVDDASTFDFLGTPLEQFISEIPKTKVLRNPDRQGLIKTRMNGARVARGDVIIFLDAHIEVGQEWIEPLLEALGNNRRLILSPAVDTIYFGNMEYQPRNISQYSGAFTWTYDYIWKEVPQHVQRNRRTEADVIPTPTFVACAIAVDRRFFFEIGAFDEGMAIWGGENLEVSFRYWMCADGVQIIPCSHIGHVYRSHLPYSIGASGTIQKNYQRSADVWMDDYARFYYAAIHQRYKYTDQEASSLQLRKQLRQRLQCKSFQWYLDTVIPEMFVPWQNATFQGQMTNLASHTCLELNPETGYLDLAPCRHDRRQYFYYLLDQRLFYDGIHCVTILPDYQVLKLAVCTGEGSYEQQWSVIRSIKMKVRKAAGGKALTSATLVRMRSHHGDGGQCLTQKTVEHRKQRAGLWPCDENESFAHWEFTYRMDFSVFDEPPIET